MWITGCPTGEDAYAVAMLFQERMRELSNPAPVKIFATVRDTAVRSARRGVSPQRFARGVPRDLLRRYFVAAGSGYRVRRTLREMCAFNSQETIAGAPSPGLDLIVCRNLMDRLSPARRRKALAIFHTALKPERYLMLGGSQTAEPLQGRFLLVGKRSRVFLKEAGAKDRAATATEATTTHRTVLLVEDSGVVRSLVREVLEQRGYQVLEARDAAEALALNLTHAPSIHLLLTDLMLPGMSGEELSRLLHRRREGLGVVYMSGYSSEALHEAERDAVFLQKPFTPDELVQAVRTVLHQGRSR